MTKSRTVAPALLGAVMLSASPVQGLMVPAHAADPDTSDGRAASVTRGEGHDACVAERRASC